MKLWRLRQRINELDGSLDNYEVCLRVHRDGRKRDVIGGLKWVLNGRFQVNDEEYIELAANELESS